MITRLEIQGLAIIDKLSIEFSPGFNVITGETGAGKSILIRGMHLLMGGKASADSVRKGNETATVVGEFWVPKGHQTLRVLDSLGLKAEVEDVGACVLIRRQISAKGKSQSWVNDTPVTSQALRDLGMTLIDIFGQHENQRLMDEAHHVRYLDDVVGTKHLHSAVRGLFDACSGAIKKLGESLALLREGDRNRDYLLFRYNALKEFEPTLDDYANVERLCREQDKAVALRDTVVTASNLLDGSSEELSPAKAVREAARLLGQIPPAFAKEGEALKARALSIASELDDLSYDLAKISDGVEVDEAELEAAQTRLFGYQDLFRKHGVKELAALLEESDRLRVELDFLESGAEGLETTLKDLGKLTRELRVAAGALTAARQSAARAIKKKAERELQDLAMAGAKLDVEFVPIKRGVAEMDFSGWDPKLETLWMAIQPSLAAIGPEGAEKSRFLLAANQGEALLPLAKIASGGELSRIMLALKKALVADAETCVLVFDEIDSGISGRIADVVGRKMQELAEGFQVVCISHLPQVAVYADTHFLVSKAGKKDRTESTIVRMSRSESAAEIARLLSGEEVSRSSLANAQSLMEKARSKKSASRSATT